MHASRAYIAGFGTTSVLVASALLLLAVVSALVAFRDWPGTGLTESISSLVVDEPQRQAVEVPPQVALNAPSAAAAVAASPAPGTAAAASTGLTAAGTADVRRTADVGIPTPTVGPEGGAELLDGGGTPRGRDDSSAPPNDQPPGGLLSETPLSPQVNRLTNGLGNTTQGLTDGLGGTVGRLNPQLGQTVTDTGQALAELLRGLGRPRR